MIVCTVNKNNNSYAVEIKGHSGYEAIGKDIVCSSVSTAFILTVNLLNKMNYKFDFISDENIPMMKLEVINYDSVVENIIDNMLDCLNDVSKQYQKYLKIK